MAARQTVDLKETDRNRSSAIRTLGSLTTK